MKFKKGNLVKTQPSLPNDSTQYFSGTFEKEFWLKHGNNVHLHVCRAMKSNKIAIVLDYVTAKRSDPYLPYLSLGSYFSLVKIFLADSKDKKICWVFAEDLLLLNN